MRTLPLDRPGPLDPPPAHAQLRPIARVVGPQGTPAWLVTGYDAAVTVLTDARFGVTPPGGGYEGNDTLFQDGDAHNRLRRLVSRAFTPRRIAAMGERIEKLAVELVDAMLAAGPPADLVADLAAPLSITVIGELLGVREIERFRLLADGAALPAEDQRSMELAWGALLELAGELVTATRERPGDDLLSDLIAVRDSDDGRLGDAELAAMVTTLVGAGYVSTANAIAVGVMQLVGEGRLSDVDEAVVEEVLRRQSGVTGEPMGRWATADADVAGMRIAAGDLVLVRLEGANRDPQRFPEPDRFRPGRPHAHIAFGRGPHHCLGAALARSELLAVLRVLAQRAPDLRLAVAVEDVAWVHGFVDSGPAVLPVTW